MSTSNTDGQRSTQGGSNNRQSSYQTMDELLQDNRLPKGGFFSYGRCLEMLKGESDQVIPMDDRSILALAYENASDPTTSPSITGFVTGLSLPINTSDRHDDASIRLVGPVRSQFRAYPKSEKCAELVMGDYFDGNDQGVAVSAQAPGKLSIYPRGKLQPGSSRALEVYRRWEASEGWARTVQYQSDT